MALNIKKNIYLLCNFLAALYCSPLIEFDTVVLENIPEKITLFVFYHMIRYC